MVDIDQDEWSMPHSYHHPINQPVHPPTNQPTYQTMGQQTWVQYPMHQYNDPSNDQSTNQSINHAQPVYHTYYQVDQPMNQPINQSMNDHSSVMLSPFVLDEGVNEKFHQSIVQAINQSHDPSIDHTIHHSYQPIGQLPNPSIDPSTHRSISACDSDSESLGTSESSYADLSVSSPSTGRSANQSPKRSPNPSTNQPTNQSINQPSNHQARLIDVLTTGMTAAELRRPRIERKRRSTQNTPILSPATGRSASQSSSQSTKPVAQMTEYERRERNKQFAADYRKRRKNYVTDLETRLDHSINELAKKEEALRVAISEISSLKEQIGLFHSFANQQPINQPMNQPINASMYSMKRVGINGMSSGRRVSGAKGAMSIALLTFISCLLCQFGFFDSSVNQPTDLSIGQSINLPDFTWQSGAPDCSNGGCNRNRFLQWETDSQYDLLDFVDPATSQAIDQSANELDLDAASAQMEAINQSINQTTIDWLDTPKIYINDEDDFEADQSNFISILAKLMFWESATT